MQVLGERIYSPFLVARRVQKQCTLNCSKSADEYQADSRILPAREFV